jgi:hypothetical protein
MISPAPPGAATGPSGGGLAKAAPLAAPYCPHMSIVLSPPMTALASPVAKSAQGLSSFGLLKTAYAALLTIFYACCY